MRVTDLVNRIALLLSALAGLAVAQEPFRPPAVPLVTSDPYLSIWSMADRLADDTTRHWTGVAQPLTAMARIDGKTYRIMGKEPPELPALPQVGLEVLPTRSIYQFEGAGIGIALTFLSPLLPRDLEVLSRPVTYVNWEARSTDGRPHETALYFDAAADLAVNTPEQRVGSSRFRLGDLDVLRMGSQEQPVLEKAGDNLRIDWGYLYVAATRGGAASQAAAGSETRAAFQKTGRLGDSDDRGGSRPARERTPVLAFCFDLGRVGPASVSRHLMLAYDDLFSIEYLHRRLRPFWRRNGAEASDLLIAAEREFSSIFRRAVEFDRELMADLRQAGGDNYMRLCALAYRQAIAAHKLAADVDGTPLFFPKENFSNGCISTVDVIYPSAPLLLLLNPKLLEASLVPVLEYARLPDWPFPFAPHDLGKYPRANGQVYGGAETSEKNQMPIEESGNFLILMAAIAETEGDAAFATRYWPLLSRWAAYLKAKGLDPENQLSTDDFMGHLAHNANLSLKAILALGAYSSLCARTGKVEEAAAFRATTEQYARQWMELARAGDHYRLAFDAPETWSQKYNLVWDRLLGLNLFPAAVARREIAFYKTKADPYGVPLDSRKRLTKLDWLFWTASLAENRADFDEIAAGGYRFVDHTPNRVPLADGNWTEDARQRNTAQARSVVGGVFIKMLGDRALWNKWSHHEVSRPATP